MCNIVLWAHISSLLKRIPFIEDCFLAAYFPMKCSAICTEKSLEGLKNSAQ